jgi:hypothetical protein
MSAPSPLPSRPYGIAVARPKGAKPARATLRASHKNCRKALKRLDSDSNFGPAPRSTPSAPLQPHPEERHRRRRVSKSLPLACRGGAPVRAGTSFETPASQAPYTEVPADNGLQSQTATGTSVRSGSAARRWPTQDEVRGTSHTSLVVTLARIFLRNALISLDSHSDVRRRRLPGSRVPHSRLLRMVPTRGVPLLRKCGGPTYSGANP